MNRIIQDKDTVIKWGIRIAILLALVGFVIPYCCVSCSGQSQNVSACEFAIGAELFGEKIDAYPVVWTLLISPLILIAVLAVYDQIKTATRKVFEICAAVVHFIANSYIKNLLTDECNSSGGTLEMKAGYTFMIVFIVLTVGIAVLDCFMKEEDILKSVSGPPDTPNRLILPPPVNLGLSAVTGPKKALLVGVSGQYKDCQFDISDGSTVIMGRDTGVCHIIFDPDEKMISRKHCSVRYSPNMDRFIIENFSKNKITFSNGEQLSEGESKTVGRGENFFLATEKNTFKVV